MKRREFLRAGLGASIPIILTSFSRTPLLPFRGNLFRNEVDADEMTQSIFSKIINKAVESGWSELPVGECMGRIAQLLCGTQYIAGTIEGPGPEVCRVEFTGMDCVTFFENVLCLSRILKKGKTSFDDFIEEVTFTRYRGGKLTDYTSRLHYISDWIYDNEKKNVVQNITREIGGKQYPVKVSFMSDYPMHYSALEEFPEFIPVIAEFERKINSRQHWYIPKRMIKRVQKHLQTGDIIAFATSKDGLDYAHTGMACRDRNGKLRLFHASSKKKKVFLDAELYEYIMSVETHIGITVARPLEFPVTVL